MYTLGSHGTNVHLNFGTGALAAWACVTTVTVVHGLKRGLAWSGVGLSLVLALLVSAVQGRYDQADLGDVATLAALGVGTGLIAGFSISLLTGFVRSSVPRNILADIERAEELLKEAERVGYHEYLPARKSLELLAKSAHSLALSTGELRGHLCFFSQGMGSSGWNRLEQARTLFEKIGSDLAFCSMRRASEVESAEMATLWRSMADEERYYAELLNSTLVTLASRISFYNLLTALVVSSGALLATVVIGIMQIRLT